MSICVSVCLCLSLSPPKKKPKTDQCLCRPVCVCVQEMVRILHLKKEASGRYKLVRANKAVSVLQQAQFVRSFPDTWRARVHTLQEADRLRREEAAAAAAAAAAAGDAGDAAPPSVKTE